MLLIRSLFSRALAATCTILEVNSKPHGVLVVGRVSWCCKTVGIAIP